MAALRERGWYVINPRGFRETERPLKVDVLGDEGKPVKSYVTSEYNDILNKGNKMAFRR